MSLLCPHSWRICLLCSESLVIFFQHLEDTFLLSSSFWCHQWENLSFCLFVFEDCFHWEALNFLFCFTMMCLDMIPSYLPYLRSIELLEFHVFHHLQKILSYYLFQYCLCHIFSPLFLELQLLVFDIVAMSSMSFTSLNSISIFQSLWFIIQFTKSFFSCISSDIKELHWVINVGYFFSTGIPNWFFFK